jgi:hypothetical protein
VGEGKEGGIELRGERRHLVALYLADVVEGRLVLGEESSVQHKHLH